MRLIKIGGRLIAASGFTFAACYFAVGLHAQSDPQISGFVRDATNNAVPGAYVVLFQGGNRTRTIQATAQGQFVVTGDVTAGDLVIRAERIGYLTCQASRKVFSGSAADVDLRLIREISDSATDAIRVQVGPLAVGSSITATAIFQGTPTAIGWKLEKKFANDWEEIPVTPISPSELLHYQFVAADINSFPHVEFRLSTTIHYANEVRVASRTFLASAQSLLIDGEL
ncbi:carboxypeptidase-like regulatory domain-containing protein [Schlesneria sp.]|uniref:carboxypeptidase-like regulatory domain-containing protein n=1 Tax=Schlesneria sp. TaxID=2762018 RepID=UPI002EFB9241